MQDPPALAQADADARRAHLRQRQLLLILQQWGPGYHRVTGCGYRYVAEIAHATPAEWEWLRDYVTEHPESLVEHHPLRTPAKWREVRREQGLQAFQLADAAYRSGQWATCLSYSDDAFVYGYLSEEDWSTLHTVVYTKLTHGVGRAGLDAVES